MFGENNMKRPVAIYDEDEETVTLCESISEAARVLGKDESTVRRALTGDRGRKTSGDCRIMEINDLDSDMLKMVV